MSAGDLIARLMEKGGGKNIMKRMELWANWETVMGPGVGNLGVPLEVKGKTLFIGADDNMAMQELNMQTYYILQRANGYLKEHPLDKEEHFDKIRITLRRGRKALTGRPEKAPAQPFQVPKAPPLPPEGFGALKNKLDSDNPVGSCYKAVHRIYFPSSK